MLAAGGYCKLVDFGFAKVVADDRTYTLVGTTGYLAPELVLGQGYGRAVDFWALGVLLFGVAYGLSPFDCDGGGDDDGGVTAGGAGGGDLAVYRKILAGDIQFPSAEDLREMRAMQQERGDAEQGQGGGRSGGDDGEPNPLLNDLVRRLCTKAPSHRLGAMAGGALDVQRHSAFGALFEGTVSASQPPLSAESASEHWWRQLEVQALPPPIVPAESLRGPVDISMFDEAGEDEDEGMGTGGGEGAGALHAFEDAPVPTDAACWYREW